MGCKGSKKSVSTLSYFRYCWGRRRNRVGPLEEEHALNKKNNSPTPIRAGVSDENLQISQTLLPHAEKCDYDLITNPGLCLKTDTTWIANQILGHPSRLPPLHRIDLVNSNREDEIRKIRNSSEDLIFEGPKLKKKRPLAAKGYSTPLHLNRLSLPGIATSRNPEDHQIDDDLSQNLRNGENISTEVEGKERIVAREKKDFDNDPTVLDSRITCLSDIPRVVARSSDSRVKVLSDTPCFITKQFDTRVKIVGNIPGIITKSCEERAHPQSIGHTPAKGQRKRPLFRRPSAPRLPHIIGNESNISGPGYNIERDLVIEDIEELGDLDV